MQSPQSLGPPWLVYQHHLALAQFKLDAESAEPDDAEPKRLRRHSRARRLTGQAVVKFGRWLEGPRGPVDRPSFS